MSNYTRNLFADTGRYGYSADYWGFDTQPTQVYDALQYCNDNFNYIAIFYKGHSYPVDCDVPNCPLPAHYSVYDSEGLYESKQEFIKDYEVHEQLDSGKVRFAWLWTCGSAWDNTTGGFYGDHSFGWEASLMGRTDLSKDAYHTWSSDSSGYCYIGFANFSIWYTMGTGLDGYNYGHFLYYFYYYALHDNNTIRDALDLATRATHDIQTVPSFGDCQLWTGYDMTDFHAQGEPIVRCYMRVWGDGGIILPQ